MHIERLFAIVYILMGKGGVTARELAERFEVSTRTIYRDIDALCAAGIPIYTVQGSGGGIFLQEDFLLSKSVLTEEEQKQILVALRSVSATGQLESSGLLERLGGLFQKSATDWIEVDFSGWGNQEADTRRFNTLRDAILDHQAVSFDYAASNGRSGRRTVTPQRLVFKNGAWYLQAYCHDRAGHRLFKLRRMTRLSPEEDVWLDAPPPPSINQAKDTPTQAVIQVILRFAPEIAYRAFDEFPHIEREEDGSIIAVMTVPEDNWIYGYILSFGVHVEVLSPPRLREQIGRIAEEIARRSFNTTH